MTNILDTNSIFIDFDGVIKESVEVKSEAFEKLFLPFGKEISKKVRNHHELNGGMSRFEKLPIYFSFAGLQVNQNLISDYSKKFSNLVITKVIDSNWVPGVKEFLKNNFEKINFFLITATPQKEIEEITKNLKIKRYFKSIIGSPTKKLNAIKDILYNYELNPNESLMIGDSENDYLAAVDNMVPFILRKTNLNKKLQNQINCQMIENFLYE